MVCIAKSLDSPDQKVTFEHGQIQMVNLPGVTIARAQLSPGWRWSLDARPTAKTESCQVAHSAYVVSGRFHVRMDDGTELELGPGDGHVVSPGHDAWVVGEHECVIIDYASRAG